MKLALAATVYHICLEGNSRTLIAKLEASIDSLVPDFSVLPVNRNSSRLEEGPFIRGNYSQTQSGIAPQFHQQQLKVDGFQKFQELGGFSVVFCCLYSFVGACSFVVLVRLSRIFPDLLFFWCFFLIRNKLNYQNFVFLKLQSGSACILPKYIQQVCIILTKFSHIVFRLEAVFPGSVFPIF